MSNPDPAERPWLTTVLARLPGRHRYQVTIKNASSVGYIDSFEWYPPGGVQVLRVVGSSSGHCVLGGLSGFGGNQFKTVLLYPNVFCDRVTLKPPTCTCRGDGGSMTISVLVDTGALNAAGAAHVLSATPVLNVIPSYPTSASVPKGN